jgi:hypothetical protein
MTDNENHPAAPATNTVAEIDDADLNQVVGGDAPKTPPVTSHDIPFVKHIDKSSAGLF